jgi:hypothetical protein
MVRAAQFEEIVVGYLRKHGFKKIEPKLNVEVGTVCMRFAASRLGLQPER